MNRLKMIDFLNSRLRSFKTPWYRWSIDITWDKLEKWAKKLGWKEE